jgi:hypothetical protein
MRSRNYTKEIGVTSTERPVPTSVAFVILAIVAVVAIYFVRQVVAFQPAHQASADQPAPMKTASR